MVENMLNRIHIGFAKNRAQLRTFFILHLILYSPLLISFVCTLWGLPGLHLLLFLKIFNYTRISRLKNSANKMVVFCILSLQSYDRQHKNRKCLLLHKNKTDTHGDDSQHMMVEPPPFDIYLCDNCDAELYSKEAIFVSKKIIKSVAMAHSWFWKLS